MKNMIGAPVREVGRPRPPAVAWCSQVYAAGGCTGVTPGRQQPGMARAGRAGQERAVMSQRSTGPAGPPAGEDWPDDLWPADDDPGRGDPAGGGGTGAGGTPPLPPGWPDGTPRARRVRPAVMAAVILAAAAAGAGVTAAAVHQLASPAGTGTGGGPLPVNRGSGAPGGGVLPGGGTGPGSGTLPGGVTRPGGGTGPVGSMVVIGTVTAVS